MILPSFGSFVQAVLETILEIDQSETKIGYGGNVCIRIGMKCSIFIEDLP